MYSRMNNIIENLKLANSYAINTQLFLAFNAFRYPKGQNSYTLHYAALYTDSLYYNLADAKLDIIRDNFKYRFGQEIVTLNIISNNKSKYSKFTDYCTKEIKELQVNIFDIKSFFSVGRIAIRSRDEQVIYYVNSLKNLTEFIIPRACALINIDC